MTQKILATTVQGREVCTGEARAGSSCINAGWDKITYAVPVGDAQVPGPLQDKMRSWRSLASALGRSADQPIVWQAIRDDFGWRDVGGQDIFDVQVRKWERHPMKGCGSLQKGLYFFIPCAVTIPGRGTAIRHRRQVMDTMRRRYGLNQKGTRHLRDFGTVFEVLALLKSASDESNCRPAEYFGFANCAVTETVIELSEQHLFVFPGYDKLRIGSNSEQYAPITSFGFFPLGFESMPVRQ